MAAQRVRALLYTPEGKTSGLINTTNFSEDSLFKPSQITCCCQKHPLSTFVHIGQYIENYFFSFFFIDIGAKHMCSIPLLISLHYSLCQKGGKHPEGTPLGGKFFFLSKLLDCHSRSINRIIMDHRYDDIFHTCGSDQYICTYTFRREKIVNRHRIHNGQLTDMVQFKGGESELITSISDGRIMVWDEDVRDPVREIRIE